ncbi:hypothetical protein B0H63DRAFT_478317 [Podospora didyma]|uniref:ZZ-type domain-containing protein n=1 Tax=Podospora didyma TaxID=330526 RepID=A0AAE0KJQ3_9PEZI|nr:hypothetical protein B0H63DRAFT_478317 [Podospora didyma]
MPISTPSLDRQQLLARRVSAMASSSTTSPDTLILLKVNHDGVSRRIRMPLRDLVANSLESKLRLALGLSDEASAVFERYSDSAGAYVVLDQTNTAVYKQLYRAAKAKQKLKIRVTALKENAGNEADVEAEPEEERTGPKPASVEDEAEAEDEIALPVPAPVVASEEPERPVVSPSSSTVPQEPIVEAAAYPDLFSVNAHVREHLDAVERIQATMVNNLSFSRRSAKPVSAGPVCPMRSNYAVCCNNCDQHIPEAHYHCSTCDDGDFDLCQECVDQGVTCHGADHWLIKRFVNNGLIINSTTERIAPKPKVKEQPQPSAAAEPIPTPAERIIPIFNDFLYSSIRTCNCCVQELPEVEFVHCTTCDDYDLCRSCFAKNRHGHHPKHGFVAAVEGTRLETDVARRLGPGRDQTHNAYCDGCDERITGIRHKCLDCPDWDYCSNCVQNASFIHPEHRFVPIYEPLEMPMTARIRSVTRLTHVGICCDGPLCSSSRNSSTYIVGERYKCAVCHDTDFCASCEASPANTHNRTHPLIKFKTPVRHVSVTTTGEHENGRQMPAMGDRIIPRPVATSSRATETTSPNTLANVSTVVDVKPSEPISHEEPVAESKKDIENLVATYVHDTVVDGTVFSPDHVFEQTWVLRNDGLASWPAGCSVKYVGGDYMGHIDPNHPAATEDLESSSESTICHSVIGPGERFAFTVLLRTPQRSGRFVSNWRLTTPDGQKFGHRVWCDIIVEQPEETLESNDDVEQEAVDEEEVEYEPAPAPVEVKVEVKEDEAKEAAPADVQQSQMIFPKLEKESPVSSIHEETKSDSTPTQEEDYEDCDDEWDASDDGFLTDEEYDILDASDEEQFEGQHKQALKK